MIPPRFTVEPVGSIQGACDKCGFHRLTVDARPTKAVFTCPACAHAFTYPTTPQGAAA